MATLRLAELIAPLAVASDCAAGLPPETALRTVPIGVALGPHTRGACRVERTATLA
jgi:hypothetical protein